MFARSNLQLAPALQERWAASLSQDASVRCVQVLIEGEALTLGEVAPRRGTAAEDFEAIVKGGLLADESETLSMYILFNLADGPGEVAWAIVVYIPTGTPVRSKMLYSSSLAGLKHGLGAALFCAVYQVHDRADASFAALRAKAKASGSRRGPGAASSLPAPPDDDAPLTELERLKLAERHSVEQEQRVRLPALTAVPFALQEEAKAAVRDLVAATAAPAASTASVHNWVELVVGRGRGGDGGGQAQPQQQQQQEVIRLGQARAVPSLLSPGFSPQAAAEELAALIPQGEARFLVVTASAAGALTGGGPSYKHALVLSCTEGTPVRSKMLCATAKKALVAELEALGLSFATVAEIQEAGDMASVLADLLSSSSSSSAASMTSSASTAAAGAAGGAAEGVGGGGEMRHAVATRPRAPGKRSSVQRIKLMGLKDDEEA